MYRLWVSKCYTCISNAKEKEQINVPHHPPPLTMYCIFWHTCISFIYIALSICQNIQFYRYMYVRLSTTTTKHSAKTTNIRFIDKFENRQCEKSWKLVICKYTVYSYMVKDVQVNKNESEVETYSSSRRPRPRNQGNRHTDKLCLHMTHHSNAAGHPYMLAQKQKRHAKQRWYTEDNKTYSEFIS